MLSPLWSPSAYVKPAAAEYDVLGRIARGMGGKFSPFGCQNERVLWGELTNLRLFSAMGKNVLGRMFTSDILGPPHMTI